MLPRQPTVDRLALPRFNPHPTRRPGATCNKKVKQSRFCIVSILTRPGGRVLRGTIILWASVSGFQSSPDPEAGCYSRISLEIIGIKVVSILTRPGGRVLQRLASFLAGRCEPRSRILILARFFSTSISRLDTTPYLLFLGANPTFPTVIATGSHLFLRDNWLIVSTLT